MKSLFSAIDMSSVKTVANRHKLAAATTADVLSSGTNIDDLE